MSMSPPALRGLLFFKLLSDSELLLLLAMLEHSKGTGQFVWPSIERLAAYTKLKKRTVQRLIHGYIDDRYGIRRKGLLERGILSQLAPSNGAKHNTATYRINFDALSDDPAMKRYVWWQQQQLPGISRPAANGEPIPDNSVTQCHPDHATMSPAPVTQCHPPGDTMSPDSVLDSVFDSKSKHLQLPCRDGLTRGEHERRDALRRVTRAGLRDYSKNPAEDWERGNA